MCPHIYYVSYVPAYYCIASRGQARSASSYYGRYYMCPRTPTCTVYVFFVLLYVDDNEKVLLESRSTRCCGGACRAALPDTTACTIYVASYCCIHSICVLMLLGYAASRSSSMQ